MEQSNNKNKKLFIGIGILIAVFAVAFFLLAKKTDTNFIMENPQRDFNMRIVSENKKSSVSTSTISTTSLPKNIEKTTSTLPTGKLKIPSVLNAPLGWKTFGTSVRHRIYVATSTKLSVNGKPLEYGDYLGAFYQSGSELKIAGFLMWKGEPDSLFVWGDDLNTPAKDGFSKGEIFEWKIWKNLEKKMYTANAEFFPVGYGSSTATDSWISGGVSILKSLVGY
ncbi:MAG: hypothetical protein AAB631_01140 [Patescibacteria group bacterium]